MVNFCANALHKEVLPVPGGPEGRVVTLLTNVHCTNVLFVFY